MGPHSKVPSVQWDGISTDYLEPPSPNSELPEGCRPRDVDCVIRFHSSVSFVCLVKNKAQSNYSNSVIKISEMEKKCTKFKANSRNLYKEGTNHVTCRRVLPYAVPSWVIAGHSHKLNFQLSLNAFRKIKTLNDNIKLTTDFEVWQVLFKVKL